jgi:hypothetical protein
MILKGLAYFQGIQVPWKQALLCELKKNVQMDYSANESCKSERFHVAESFYIPGYWRVIRR